MHVEDAIPADSPSTPRRWARPVVARTVAAYEERVPASTTQRQFALEAGVARTTLQYWLARKDALDADPAVIAFFESPEGLAVLHRIVGAAHMAFTQVGPCGIRLVSMFLELVTLTDSWPPHLEPSRGSRPPCKRRSSRSAASHERT